jgi:uncharacterized membrane protein
MTHNLSFFYHVDMTTNGLGLRLGLRLGVVVGLGLGSAKIEVLLYFYPVRVLFYFSGLQGPRGAQGMK